jgi:hypothetical protein
MLNQGQQLQYPFATGQVGVYAISAMWACLATLFRQFAVVRKMLFHRVHELLRVEANGDYLFSFAANRGDMFALEARHGKFFGAGLARAVRAGNCGCAVRAAAFKFADVG